MASKYAKGASCGCRSKVPHSLEQHRLFETQQSEEASDPFDDINAEDLTELLTGLDEFNVKNLLANLYNDNRRLLKLITLLPYIDQ